MEQPRTNSFMMSDGVYNWIKRLVQIIIPAFGTFYFSMAGVWDFPNADKVSATCLALSAFLGLCLGISNAQYNASGKGIDGSLTIGSAPPNGSPVITGISLPKTEEEIEGKKSITLQVKHEGVLVSPEVLEEEDEDDEPPMNPATSRKPVKKAAKKPPR